jgi:peptidoglycan/xylan/chitin deacetylase (PgdA/CDA1 family)
MFETFRRMLARFSDGFVVAFHDIPPEKVAAFLDALRPAFPIPLGELVKRERMRKRSAGLFAITVDDGVGDTVRSLSRLFIARQWPATFYLPTAYIDSGESMAFQWWRRIRPLLPARKIQLSSCVLDLSRPGAIEQLSKTVEQHWHSSRLDAYLPLTMELADFVARDRGVRREALQPSAPITWSEVTTLARGGIVQFESHGVSHTAMSSLSDDELAVEMLRSREIVSEHTGRACRHLAYPFGSWTSIGPRAATAAARYYDSAVTMTLGHIGWANPALLPRIPLYPENSNFVARLKVALKCTSLQKPRAGVAENPKAVASPHQ